MEARSPLPAGMLITVRYLALITRAERLSLRGVCPVRHKVEASVSGLFALIQRKSRRIGRSWMDTVAGTSNGIGRKLLWVLIAILGAASLGIVALSRGETISAAWLVIAAVCV